MIITQPKAFDDVKQMLKGYNKILVVGCGECSTLCQTGGEEQVKEMAEVLEEQGKSIDTIVIETPCDERISKRDFRRIGDRLTDSESLLGMMCGVGVQTLTEITGKDVIPALDTKFLGRVERIGRFFETCQACGECVLFEAGGICPKTRCAKGLMNGPCGGQVDGKCEVGDYEKDCAWVSIWRRLKDLGRLDLFLEFRTPRDWQLASSPRELIVSGEA